jgi:acetoin utilization deacetylase AcuC-like enzyme
MLRPGFLIDKIYLRHDPGIRHPESPRRLRALWDAVEELGASERWLRLESRAAHEEDLELIHHRSLHERVERLVRRAPAHLDADTVVSQDSYVVALHAVGGVLACVDALLCSRVSRFFAFVRPPGHHAEPGRSMGFCLFNNVALAAAYARVVHGLERVAVIDFDLHHGNGTQACFYDDPHVLFVSSHQYPFYPGTGAIAEIGIREGRGYTVNFPLQEGAGNELFVPIYASIVGPILEQYRPQLILVSAGFDAHFKDPLGGLNVSAAGFGSAAASLIRAADQCCSGRIGFVLEGGYSPEGLAESARAVMEQMELSDPKELRVTETAGFIDLSDEVRTLHGGLWRW